jgi:ankyrin repeat protein
LTIYTIYSSPIYVHSSFACSFNRADIGTIGGEYTSALWAAATWSEDREACRKIIHFLLESGANSIPHGKYDNSLQAASAKGRNGIVRELLSNGAHGKYWDKELHHGSALQLAAAGGHVLIVDLLIKHGANPNTRGQQGTPLQSAIASGHEGIVRSLIKAGADISSKAVLQVAAWKLHMLIFDSLMAQGYANHHQDDIDAGCCTNALHTTAGMSSQAIARYLVENSANNAFFTSTNINDAYGIIFLSTDLDFLHFKIFGFVCRFMLDLRPPQAERLIAVTEDVQMELF